MNLETMTWPDVRDVAQQSVALLPLGATEQHGRHLAVSTDTAIVTRIAAQVEANLPEDVVLYPTLAFGSSHHHLDFPGTLSLSPTVFTQVTIDLIQSMVQSGFRRIMLLNGHGGNITPAKQALAIFSQQYKPTVPPWVVLATYWELAGAPFAGEPPLESSALSHACEYETSMMLFLFPDRVRMRAVQRPAPAASPAPIDWDEDAAARSVSFVMKTQYLSGNGASGQPHLATMEKGRHLVAQATASITTFVTQFKQWPFLEARSDA